MTTIYLGIDNGNYNTKSSDHILYPSGFAVQDTEFIVPDQQLQYGGKYYAIGDSRMSFQQEKANELDTFLLSLPMMAHAMKLNHTHDAEFVLGVGLPLDVYGTQKDAFRQYFLRGRVEFRYEREKYSAIIRDCKVFPQGHAALCHYFSQLRNYQSIAIVDIGGYTVDVMNVINAKPIRSSCMSLRKGTITLFNGIRSVLQQHNILLTDELIANAIRGRSEHRQKELILGAVTTQVQAYLKDLLNALREHGLDLDLPVAFAGGGAELLQEQLKACDVNVVAIPMSWTAVDASVSALLAPSYSIRSSSCATSLFPPWTCPFRRRY